MSVYYLLVDALVAGVIVGIVINLLNMSFEKRR